MGQEITRILLVEDNAGDARLIHEMLDIRASDFFEIVHAERLGEAIRLLEEDHFDIVLLDLSLPDSQGLTTFQKVYGQFEEVPIVVLTGLDDETVATKAVNEGAQDYLVKGQSDSKSLVRSIRYAIERHNKWAEQLQEARREGFGKIFSFIGAKGGVGTTTIALNVASALSKDERSVIAVELRSHLGTLPLYVNKVPCDNLCYLLELRPEQIDKRELRRRLLKTRYGFNVLAGPQKAEEFREITFKQAEAIVRGLAGMADFVIVDLPCHPCSASRAAVLQSNSVVLSVEPDIACVESAKTTLEMLKLWDVCKKKVGVVVVNRTALPSQMSLPDIKKRLGCEIIGVVPYELERLEDYQDSGATIELYETTSLAATYVNKIAIRLDAEEMVAMEFE